jgi:L-threonylcarbamoyladenylate synthase
MPDLKPFIDLIRAGEVVAFPTETVYGLGADAWNPSAIQKVFKTKDRPSDNPLIVHISDQNQLKTFVTDIPEDAQKLIDQFWPGPLTLVFKKRPKVLDLITAGLDTVAIRMPDHMLALSLITETGPLVAPSANKSGRPSPTKAEHVKVDFGGNFPVIDGGPTEVGIESTVLDLTSNVPAILRPGKIGKKEIQDVLGIEIQSESFPQNTSPKSPGQKYSHYKPEADIFYGNIETIKKEVLYLVQNDYKHPGENVISYNGNLNLLSKELYDRFRQADLDHYSAVFIQDFEEYKSSSLSVYTALLNRIEKAKS